MLFVLIFGFLGLGWYIYVILHQEKIFVELLSLLDNTEAIPIFLLLLALALFKELLGAVVWEVLPRIDILYDPQHLLLAFLSLAILVLKFTSTLVAERCLVKRTVSRGSKRVLEFPLILRRDHL